MLGQKFYLKQKISRLIGPGHIPTQDLCRHRCIRYLESKCAAYTKFWIPYEEGTTSSPDECCEKSYLKKKKTLN